MTTVSVESADGEVFKIGYEVAKQCISIRTMIEDLGEGGEEEVIPLGNIRSVILKKVLDWCDHHKNDNEVLQNEQDFMEGDGAPKLSAYDAQFVQMDQATMFECILAANFLDIPGLLKLLCRQVATMIQGRSPDEIRETFNIVNDLSSDEEENIRADHDHIKDKEELMQRLLEPVHVGSDGDADVDGDIDNN